MSGWNEDDWGTPSDNTNSWDNWDTDNEPSWENTQPEPVQQQQPVNNNWNTEEDAYWNNQEQFQETAPVVQEGDRSPIKLGSKMVAVILACGFLVIALVLVVLSNMGKGDNTTPSQQQSNNSQQSQQQVQQNSGGMVQIPNNIALDYSGEIYSVNATIRNKVKYKDGNQVVYCLELSANFGTTTEVWNYYCSYSAFSNVKVRDSVYVEYQVPQEGYISIVSVSK